MTEREDEGSFRVLRLQAGIARAMMAENLLSFFVKHKGGTVADGKVVHVTGRQQWAEPSLAWCNASFSVLFLHLWLVCCCYLGLFPHQAPPSVYWFYWDSNASRPVSPHKTLINNQ